MTIKTATIDDTQAYTKAYSSSLLFKPQGARLYLNTNSKKSIIKQEVNNVCEVFFLPDRKDVWDNIYHSELGITKDYSYNNNCYGDLLVINIDYGYFVDNHNWTYGYSLAYGLVFYGSFAGSQPYGYPRVWHIVPE